jgi:alanyl-tRNA synthetase
VSGFVHSKYGYDNVGFHMGDEMITVDFNGILTAEELAEIEKKSNDYIWQNKQVNIFVPTAEELEKLDYRSKKELTGDVRIVEFPGADMCACCGTHITYTGEIGLVKIISVQKFHEGVRIEMLSGDRAVKYMNDVAQQNKEISVLLSAKVKETSTAVKRLADENTANKISISELYKKIFSLTAEKYRDKGNVLIFENGLTPDNVRNMANEIMEVCGGRAAVFSGDDENGYKYAIGEKDGNLKDMVKKLNAELNGRGGGKPFFVQGSVSADKESIEKFFLDIN